MEYLFYTPPTFGRKYKNPRLQDMWNIELYTSHEYTRKLPPLSFEKATIKFITV